MVTKNRAMSIYKTECVCKTLFAEHTDTSLILGKKCQRWTNFNNIRTLQSLPEVLNTYINVIFMGEYLYKSNQLNGLPIFT